MQERDRRNAHEPIVPPDPSGIPEPHDTLAAEEFGIGTPDTRMPRDPSGYHIPHDILAAEAFPMPLPDRGGAMPEDAPRKLARVAIAAVALGLAALRLSRR